MSGLIIDVTDFPFLPLCANWHIIAADTVASILSQRQEILIYTEHSGWCIKSKPHFKMLRYVIL